MTMRRHRIAYLVSHPIQYQAPLLRYLSAQPDFDLTVFFRSDHSVGSHYDEGFGKTIDWDVDLLSGYRHEFLPALGRTDLIDHLRPVNYGLARRLRGRFDALWVHGYAPWFNQSALVTAKAMGMVTLVRDEASALSKQRSPLKTALKRQTFFRFLNLAVDGYLAIGTLNRRYYEANGAVPERIFSAPYCVDNDYFQARAEASKPHRETFRSGLGLQPGRPIILYASKLQRRKKPDDLLAAYQRLDSAARPYLLFVGDGEMRAELEPAASESVRFLGFRNQSELPAFFDLCDLFVLPSVAEPWGLIVNEVMCAGKPVVVSDEVGCAPDLVKDGVNGFVFPAGDVPALARCLTALTADTAQCRAMGEASRAIVGSWGIPEVADGLRRALTSLAKH